MVKLQDCQKAIREIKKQLTAMLDVRCSYKTSSSWSSVKYVTLKCSLMKMYNSKGEPDLVLIQYDQGEIQNIFDTVCEKYGIPNNLAGLHMNDYNIEINLFSNEEA